MSHPSSPSACVHPIDVCTYIFDLTSGLAKLASGYNLDFLGYFFQTAHEEAFAHFVDKAHGLENLSFLLFFAYLEALSLEGDDGEGE